jgi:hypothetical protein
MELMEKLTSNFPEKRPECEEILKELSEWYVTIEEIESKYSTEFLEINWDMKTQFAKYFMQRKFKTKASRKVKYLLIK